MHHRTLFASAVLALGMCGSAVSWANGNDEDRNRANDRNGGDGNESVEFAETSAVIEINATDGDIGLHGLLDAAPWKEARIADPNGKMLFKTQVTDSSRDQGMTEIGFESAEFPCAPVPEEPDEEVVPLSEFVERFPAGEYRFTGKTLDNEKLEGRVELTHDLPAAPEILGFDGTTVSWGAGSDLGKCRDDALVSSGAVPDPASIEIVGWEVVVEPADEDAVDPLRVFSVQLPGNAPTSVTVPSEFVDAYTDEDVTELKVEVGAIEASGNRTFSEQEFELEMGEEP